MKDLVIKTGEYQKDGETKGEYTKVGVILSGENGEFALLDPTVNLAGCLTKQNMMNHKNGKKTGSSVMCSIFDRDQQQGQQSEPTSGDDGFDDDIPF